MRGVWRRRFAREARRHRQRVFPFLARRARIERSARLAIVIATALGLVLIWAAIPAGRAAVRDWTVRTRRAAKRRAGIALDRAEVDADWSERRDRREVGTREAFRRAFAALPAKSREFLRLAGMRPEDAVVRWGNYDMTLVFSSTVFERDDHGRYYRLRPNVRSVWIRQFNVFGLDTGQFLFPDTPEVRCAAEAAGAKPVRGSEQRTNSWGCRGAEPDRSAPVRGLVLGDSFMQGLMVGDDETPPARLAHHLVRELGTTVSVPNAGHLGYSPEHYYHTMRAYADRLRPGFVVVAFYANDFGVEGDVLSGDGDWEEGCYWLNRILEACVERYIVCLFVPVPDRSQISGSRKPGNYPGRALDVLGVASGFVCDPTEALVNEHLRIATREERIPNHTPLYNGRLADGHFSPRGADVWGRTVARRLALLLAARPSSEATDERPASPSNSDAGP